MDMSVTALLTRGAVQNGLPPVTLGPGESGDIVIPPCTLPDTTRLPEFRFLMAGRLPTRHYKIHFVPKTFLLFSQRKCAIVPVGNQNEGVMNKKTEVQQGTLALMVLKTLDVLGTLHGYGIARRIEQISGDLLAVNQGTLYPVLLKLEQEGAIASEWGASENNRRARFYRLTREGRKQLQVETQDWKQTAAIIGWFFEAKAEDLS